jgi:O-antigen/teichoic acid export membrane protein/CelD/BcsL family acetyltransferase involved in cellulose biosynthesis
VSFATNHRVAGFRASWRALLHGEDDHSIARRVAGATFALRLTSAALAYATQVILARWLGDFEFGNYVYVWTWVLLLGGFVDLGLGLAAQKFVPAYAQQRQFELLRGFVAGTRYIAFASGAGIGIAAGLVIWLARDLLTAYELVPLWIACLCLPFFALTSLQDGIARCYNWIDIGLLPSFVIRPLLMLAMLFIGLHLGFAGNALDAMIATATSLLFVAFLQGAALQIKLRRTVPPGPRAFAPGKWLATSLPIVTVVGFYILLTYVDVIVLRQYAPPEQVALYNAAAKSISLVTFVYFAVTAATAHRFSQYHAGGDHERLRQFTDSAARWTFWPSLLLAAALLILGKPLLWLFGPNYVSAYPLMFILSIGLLARAAIGPAERLLNMLGEQSICAAVFAGAFAFNLVGCLLLVPRWGSEGAAASTSAALVLESVLLFVVARKRLGLHCFVVGGRRDAAAPAAIGDQGSPVVELRRLSELQNESVAWRDLCRRAVSPNVFYEPAFALAAAPAFGRDVEVLLVRDAQAPDRWLGLLPFRRHRRGGLPILVGWTHPFAPLGVPLLDRDRAAAILAAMLAHISAELRFRAVLLPLLPQDTTCKTVFDQALALSGMETEVIDAHSRALFQPGTLRADYLASRLSASKRRQLARLRRGLEKSGPVAFELTPDAKRFLPAFLALEAAGWKGAAGTAAAQAQATRQFIVDAVSGLASENKAAGAMLTQDGKSLAVGLALRSGEGLWYWKIAHDETVSRASPGAQLTLDFTAALAADQSVAFGDSCAGPSMPMIEQFWRERLPIADLLLAPSGTRYLPLLAALEKTHRQARQIAKQFLSRMRCCAG